MWLIHSFLIILTANSLVAREIGTNENEVSSNLKPEILIIGAGAAGIAAATKLSENNFPVKILEAENRLGGRIHSVKFEDGVVDLGAEWLLSDEGIAYDLVKDQDVLKDFEFNYTFYKSDQGEVDQEVCMELLAVYVTLFSPNITNKFIDMVGSEDDVDMNMGFYFINAYKGSIEELYKEEPDKYTFAFMCLDTFERLITSDSGAPSWFDSSLGQSYVDENEDMVMHFNGKGFKVVLDRMLADSPAKDKFLYQKVVKRINYAAEDEVKVSCVDGSTYTAKHVIVTPSLGVLKRQHKHWFAPDLDEDKQEAIEALGYGNMVAVFVHYPERWWPEENFTGFSFVWTYEDRKTLPFDFANAAGSPDKDYVSWLHDFMGVFPQSGVTNVIECVFTGKQLKRIEKLSDKQIMEGITFTIDKFISHIYNVTKPDKIIRENWYSNPHFRGTFTYETVKSRSLAVPPMTTLQKPIMNKDGSIPRVLFAGEATHLTHYATVHGAIETGIREAERLISLYDKK